MDDKDPCGFAATTDDDWPTGVLPRIEDDMPDPRTSSAVAESHRHEPSAIPEPFRQVHVESDTEFLGRILDGLRRLP